MIEYERHSTTERIWVLNEGLINLRELKIQSIPTFKVLKFSESWGIKGNGN